MNEGIHKLMGGWGKSSPEKNSKSLRSVLHHPRQATEFSVLPMVDGPRHAVEFSILPAPSKTCTCILCPPRRGCTLSDLPPEHRGWQGEGSGDFTVQEPGKALRPRPGDHGQHPRVLGSAPHRAPWEAASPSPSLLVCSLK